MRRVESELLVLEKTRRAFISQMRALAERHLHELEAMEATSVPRPAATMPTTEEPPEPEQKTPAWLNAVVKED